MSNAVADGPVARATHHVAIRALVQSVLINMVAPTVVYRLMAPLFPAGSLLPLALSGLPPALMLAYTVIRLRAIDILGLIAAENVVVELLAAALAHGEQQALLGRALENPILAVVFMGSLFIGEPLALSMSRQFSTGNDPAKRAAFDAVARQDNTLKVYKVITAAWVAALLLKALGGMAWADLFTTKDYLIVNGLWSLATDGILVTWSLLYGRAKLIDRTPVAAVAQA